MLKRTGLQRKTVVGLLLVLATAGLIINHYSSANNAVVVPLLHINGHLEIPVGSPLRSIIHSQPVLLENISIPLSVPANVQVLPSKVLELIPPAAGRITQINYSLGDFIKRGDVLYTMESPDIRLAISELNQAHAAYESAKESLLRQQKMIQANLGALMDLQQAKMTYDQALSELDRSSARLSIFKVEPKDLSNDGLLHVRSALSGQVQAINVAPGSFWNDLTSSLMTVVDISEVYIVAHVQERDINAVYVGQNVDLKFADNKKNMRTKVTYIQPILSADTRTLDVAMLVKNADLSLKPNTFVTAYFLRKPKQRIVLPLTAVIQRGFDSVVFVEISPWIFDVRRVVTGLYTEQGVEVLAGLTPQDHVVLTGGILLND